MVITQSMKITINGEEKSFASELTITLLLEHLEIDTRKIAIEHNRQIVAKSTYTNTVINDGDQLEIVAFIGGG